MRRPPTLERRNPLLTVYEHREERLSEG